MEALCAEYLFDFAHLCGIDPIRLGALRLLDFAQLILGIDSYRDQINKANQANQGNG